MRSLQKSNCTWSLCPRKTSREVINSEQICYAGQQERGGYNAGRDKTNHRIMKEDLTNCQCAILTRAAWNIHMYTSSNEYLHISMSTSVRMPPAMYEHQSQLSSYMFFPSLLSSSIARSITIIVSHNHFTDAETPSRRAYVRALLLSCLTISPRRRKSFPCNVI